MDEHTPPSYDDQLPDPMESGSDKARQSRRSGAIRANREPDPGSRQAGLLTLLFLIPILIAVVLMQQGSVITASQDAENNAQQITPSGGGDIFGMMSKFTVKFYHTMAELDDTGQIADGDYFAPYLDNLDTYASSPHDMLRTAIVAGEIYDADESLYRLYETQSYIETVADRLDEQYVNDLRTDTQILVDLYLEKEITDAQRTRLADNHGWHGNLALSLGEDNADPDRAELIGGGAQLMIGLLAFGALLVLVGLAGFALLIFGIVLLSMGKLKMRFRAPGVGGSVYLETFAVFVCVFMLLQVLSGFLPSSLPDSVHYGLQWIVALSIFWPMVRGVSFHRWRHDMGLVAPNGFIREIGAGVLTYIATVPLYFVAALFSLALIGIREAITSRSSGEEAPVVSAPMSNPIFDLIEGSDTLTLVVLASLMVIWAPLVEECIMRGALYRHFRSRFIFLFSAIFSAILFGALHQYDVLMLLPIITLGAAFAYMREWRGSLVGSITAHALHNSSIFLLIIWLVSAM